MSERAVTSVRVKMRHPCRYVRGDGQPVILAGGESYYVSPADFELHLKATKAAIPQYSPDGTTRLDDKEEQVVEKADEIREPEPAKEAKAGSAAAASTASTRSPSST